MAREVEKRVQTDILIWLLKGFLIIYFFKFYSELIFNLSKPVDLIDLKSPTKFSEILVSEGVLLYG